MPSDYFWLLMNGLSEHSRFAQTWASAPKHVYQQSEIDAVMNAGLR